MRSSSVRCFPTATAMLLLFAASYGVLHVTAHTLATAAKTCTVPDKTLTFDCDSECSSKYQPCWHNASLTATADSCMYECYNIYYDVSQSSFVFLVPYGSWKSAQQIASGDTRSDVSAATSRTNDTANYISKNNDYLTTVDALLLPSTTTNVYV